ncbi:MAG: sugar ABC transporter permease [Spirochaetes bacterium]|nr:MAG: sugar ABC transporter permease [Spirochaetota bacterium]
MKKRDPRIFLFLLPSFIFLSIFTYYPIFDAVGLSFHRYGAFNPKPIFQGLKNYIDFFKDPIFWQIILNNVLFGLGTILPTMIMALIFAILINEVRSLRTFFRLSLFYPMLIPYAAAAMVWVFIYDPSLGPINLILKLLKLKPIGWLGDSRYSLIAIIIMTVWKNLGYYMLIFLAGLQNIPRDLYEAATVEGTNWSQKHWHITIPLVGPSTLFVFVVSVIQSFKVFTQIYLMTEGGPGYSSNVLIYRTYEYGFKFWQLGRASTLTTLMIMILLFLVLIVFGVWGRKITYQAA